MRLNGTHQFLVCADDVHFLGKNINTVKRNTKAFILVTSREIGLEVNSETVMHVCVSLLECRTESLRKDN